MKSIHFLLPTQYINKRLQRQIILYMGLLVSSLSVSSLRFLGYLQDIIECASW